jgi:hypothetical protein
MSYTSDRLVLDLQNLLTSGLKAGKRNPFWMPKHSFCKVERYHAYFSG